MPLADTTLPISPADCHTTGQSLLRDGSTGGKVLTVSALRAAVPSTAR